MNVMRRFGVLTTLAGAALILSSVVSAPSAASAVSQNWMEHEGNITASPSGTQFDGAIHTGSGSTALFHWTVAALSHWMLCFTVTTTTAAATTTTAEATTTTVEPTTTTVEATTTTVDATTTTNVEATTTTTVEATTTTVDSGGPTTTTTLVEGTTTTVESGGPTTTLPIDTTTTIVDVGGPTTTVADESGGPTTTAGDVLPHTGAGSNALMLLGGLLLVGGLALTIGTRRPRHS